MIAQTLIFAVLLLIMWTIVILLVWRDGREKKKGTAMKDNDLISRSALLETLKEHHDYIMQDPEISKTMKWCEAVCFRRTVDALEAAPAVDAETVFQHLDLMQEAFDMAKSTLAPVVRCENCTHQQKVWHDDKRMKEGGFFIYSCKLNDDPFVTHVVDGNPGEFCYAGERRVDE